MTRWKIGSLLCRINKATLEPPFRQITEQSVLSSEHNLNVASIGGNSITDGNVITDGNAIPNGHVMKSVAVKNGSGNKIGELRRKKKMNLQSEPSEVVMR